MIINAIDYKLAPGGRICIYQDTDTHIGNDGHDEALHRRFIQTVKNDPNSLWVHTGDLTDEDRPSTRDRKANAFHDRPEVLDKDDKRAMDEIDRLVIPRYAPIASKCLGMLDGDHFRIFRNGMTSGQYIAQKLKVKYLGERMGYISIVFRNERGKSLRYDILARHGRGAPSTASGDVAALVRQNASWDADLFFGGHTHKENAHPEPVVGVNRERDNLKQRIRWYIRGGSFLAGFQVGNQLYPEKAEYGPLCLGYGKCVLRIADSWYNNRNLSIVQSEGSVVVG